MQTWCTRIAIGLIGAALFQAQAAARTPMPDRLDQIRRRGHLTCGVAPEVAGFSAVDGRGRYSGLDVDICRAMAAAIFGDADRVAYRLAYSVHDFLRSDDIDLVSRRLTWELRREGSMRLLFGPVIFYDGQGFLVAHRLSVQNPLGLAGVPVCVVANSTAQATLPRYYHSRPIPQVVPVLAQDVVAALADGRCEAYTADVSELAALRSRLPAPADFDILPQMITKEPLAQLVRQGDDRFFDLLRWTVFALIAAEELGVNSRNVEQLLASDDPDVQRLLGVLPGNGAALGLRERWAFDVIKSLGNYGEIFDRNVGRSSPIGLDRGVNALWTAGGLMYAPPLR
jgi:general L-amino acid transport system substrate-binding protein